MAKIIEKADGPYRYEIADVENLKKQLAYIVQEAQLKYGNRQIMASVLFLMQVGIYIGNTRPDTNLLSGILSFGALMQAVNVFGIRKQIRAIGEAAKLQAQIMPIRNARPATSVKTGIEASWEGMKYCEISIMLQASLALFLTTIVIASRAGPESALIQASAGLLVTTLDALVGRSLDVAHAQYQLDMAEVTPFIAERTQAEETAQATTDNKTQLHTGVRVDVIVKPIAANYDPAVLEVATRRKC